LRSFLNKGIELPLKQSDLTLGTN